MAAPTLVSSGAVATGSAQTLAVSVPASIVTGNTLVVVLGHGGTMGTMPGTNPWTLKFGSSNNCAVAYIKTADHISNGSPSSYTFTTTSAINTITQGQIYQLSGTITVADPFDVTTTGATTASTSSPSSSLTTAWPDVYLLLVDMKNASRTVNVGPSGLTSQTTSPAVLHFWDGTQAATGGTGTKNITWTSGSNHSTTFLAIKSPLLPSAVTATAAAQPPTVAANYTASPPAATATAAANAPTVTATTNATVTGVAATATATAAVPAPSAGLSVTGVAATATAASNAPTVAASWTGAQSSADATATAAAPAVAASSTVTATAATASAAPFGGVTASGGATIYPPPSDATAEAVAPTVDTGTIVQAVTATADATAIPPDVSLTVAVAATCATATAAARPASPSVGCTLDAPAATATATCNVPRGINLPPGGISRRGRATLARNRVATATKANTAQSSVTPNRSGAAIT